MAAPFTKAHTSALCLIPPRKAWEALQKIRLFNDRNFVRWPPHINLLYPFVADQRDGLEQAAHLTTECLRETGPFEITLDTVSYFEHKSSCTIWLGSHSQLLLNLQAAVQSAFPEFDELSLDEQRNIRGFRPHLSLGQWTHDKFQESIQEIQRDYKPITFTVDSVEVISREGQTQPFMVRYRVPLGGDRSEEVNVPYVATISTESPSENALARRYGLGAMQEGVWYFAFGANMSLKKLSGSRGITPLESLPARLPAWALEFNHRGAMGNIMHLSNGSTGQGGFDACHGVLHRLKTHDFALLTSMEHEYRPTEVLVERYDRGEPVTAVAFISPPERLIQSGLPPTVRYAELLRTGAREFKLDAEYTAWLESLPTVSSEKKRGDEYWHDVDGNLLKVFPRIWKGSEAQRGGRGSKSRVGRGRSGGRNSVGRSTFNSGNRQPAGRGSSPHRGQGQSSWRGGRAAQQVLGRGNS